MNAFIDFLVNNYLIFLLIALILIFALIGYLVDSNKEEKEPKQKKEKKEVIDREEELLKTLKDIPLGEAVKEEKIEELKETIEPLVEEVPNVAPEVVEVEKEEAPVVPENNVDYDEPIIVVDDTGENK